MPIINKRFQYYIPWNFLVAVTNFTKNKNGKKQMPDLSTLCVAGNVDETRMSIPTLQVALCYVALYVSSHVFFLFCIKFTGLDELAELNWNQSTMTVG